MQEQKAKMQKFEFRVLCSDDEACKRVRFGMETGIFAPEGKTGGRPRRLPDVGKNLLGTIYYSKLLRNPRIPEQKLQGYKNCSHELPFAFYLEALKDPNRSLEVECFGCATTMTIIPSQMDLSVRTTKEPTGPCVTMNFPVLVTVDFVHYDSYTQKNRPVKVMIEDHGRLANLYSSVKR